MNRPNSGPRLVGVSARLFGLTRSSFLEFPAGILLHLTHADRPSSPKQKLHLKQCICICHLYKNTYIYIYIYMHWYIHTYLEKCVYIYIYTYVCIYVNREIDR